MNMTFSSKKVNSIFVLSLFFISCWIVLSNIGFKHSFIGADAGISSQELKVVSRTMMFTWNESDGGIMGLLNAYSIWWNLFLNFFNLFIPAKHIIRVVTIIFFFLCGMSAYYLVHVISKTEGLWQKNIIFLKLGAFLGSLFYMMNHALMVLLVEPLAKFQFFYCVFPFIFGLFILLLNKQAHFSKIFLLSWLLLIVGCGHIAYFVVIFSLLVSYLFYFMFLKNRLNWVLVRKLRPIFLIVILIILLSAYLWIPGLSVDPYVEAISISKAKPDFFLNALNFNSYRSSFLSLFRLEGYMCFFNFPYAKNYYTNPVLILLGFLIYALLPLAALIFFKKNRFIYFFALIYLLFLFLSKGTHPPLAGIFKWIYLNVPYFLIFKSQYLKFIVGPIIICTVFLSFAAAELLHRFRKFSYYIFILLVVGILGYNYVFITGNLVSKDLLVDIPKDYLEVAKFVDGIETDKKILLCPGTGSYMHCAWRGKEENWIRHYLYDHSNMYMGALIYSYLFSKPVVNASCFLKFFPDFSLSSTDLATHFELLEPLIKEYSIGYIFLKKDILEQYTGEFGIGKYYIGGHSRYLKYREKLGKKSSDFKLVLETENWEIYKLPEDWSRERIYLSSLKPTLVSGGPDLFSFLAQTKYLDSNPMLLFREQQKGEMLEKLLPKLQAFVFSNSNPLDMAVQILGPDYGIKVSDSKKPVVFEVKEDGVYQIWKRKDALQASGLRPQASGIRVDGEEVIQDTRYKIEDRGMKWKRIGKIELKKGKHRVVAEDAPQELVIVPEERITQTEEEIWNYLKKAENPPTYFFSKELSGEIDSYEERSLKGSFYISIPGKYSLRAKVSPQYVDAPDYGLKERMGRNLRKWSLVPKKVKYFTSTRKDILAVSTYLDGDSREREFLGLKRNIKPVNLEEYPNFEINYYLANPSIQRIEIILGVDLNNDGKVDIRISEELPPGLEKHSFNLYEKIRDSLGQDLLPFVFHLVKVYLKVSKKDGLDCFTSPNKGWYKVSFSDFGLYVLSEDKYVKSRDYALNERVGLHKELKRGKSKVILSRSFEDLDLEKYPYINLIHQNEDPRSLLVSMTLYLDFDSDGKFDRKITYEGVTAKHPFFDAYQLARAKFPDKNLYHLIKLEIRVSRASVFSSGDVSEEPSFSLSLQHLQIYNEEILPYEEAPLIFPVLKIDQRRLSLTKSGFWYIAPPTYLRAGYHNLDAIFPGLKTKLDFMIVEPASRIKDPVSRTEPGITFQKINPTKYKVKIKDAKEPFWLIFSESFHEGWKAYVEVQSPKSKVQSQEGNFEEIVAEYPRLGVKEVKHLQKFTPGDIKYLFRKPDIKEHYLVNGYANGWWIEPSKVQRPPKDKPTGQAKSKVKDMEIVLYFWPQSLFYLGLGISGLTFVGCAGYLVITGVKRKKKRRAENKEERAGGQVRK